MVIAPRLDLRQAQTLVMTPQLRQAIKLLQFSNIEVSAFVEDELERNPLLERDETVEVNYQEREAPDQTVKAAERLFDVADAVTSDVVELHSPLDCEHGEGFDLGGASDGPPVVGTAGRSRGFDDDDLDIDSLASETPSLRDHLGEQLRLNFSNPVDRMIGAHMIALLCPAGRLTAEPAAIAAAMGLALERIEAVRYRMMRFDPVGLFARNLNECLSVQLAEKGRLDPAMQALLSNLELLALRDLRQLTLLCGVDAEDLRDMVSEVRALNPKPAAHWDGSATQVVIPDLLMRPSHEGGWIIELNPETTPKVLVNERLYARVLVRANRDDKVFLSERLTSANWLVRSLQQRAQTILKVASEIVRQQANFFHLGVVHLRPLILRDIAAEVELHESTVSRVTANKYITTPRGIFELKYFFTAAIHATDGGEAYSAAAVRHRIRTMIDQEPPSDTLSDDNIVSVLRQEGIEIARRTVAKYREALRIPNSVQRRREKVASV